MPWGLPVLYIMHIFQQQQKKTRVRGNRTPATLVAYGFEVRNPDHRVSLPHKRLLPGEIQTI